MIRLIYFILLFFGCAVHAQQRETFDIINFTPPAGWKREIKDGLVAFSTVDQRAGTWAQLEIYSSIASSGNARGDFEHEWKELVVKRFTDIPLPDSEAVTEEGWTAHQGAGMFVWQGKPSYAVLNTITGYGRVVSIVVLTNTDKYNTVIDRVIQTIDLVKPNVEKDLNAPPSAQPASNAILISDKPGNQGISISTTNFDDGWTAKPYADYVKVTKGAITVLLHYAIELDDSFRNVGLIEDAAFNRYMQPRYVINNLRKYDNNGPCYFCIYFYEADVTEKSTGKKFYAGFRVFIESGMVRCIEILTPSMQDFQREFPNQKKVEAMWDYNKFAVTLSDLVGTWEESSGAAANMYNVVTGAYAGMSTASSAHSFTFNADGTYNSRHTGAHGMVGNMTFFDQKYDGKITVTNWDVTMTNRWEGKTEAWWAQFEAVRGGRILHLTRKTASGIHYALVKTK
ncbi:MAG: hypothetical protein N2044_10560 [Cyclobacteriaceae bacterium]|nr:hypothetical protein [Cyclobacteriaceae bacterium]MDW8332277.1 hypothetical protein [Cyclobacteriaceae bacterium]